MKKFMLVDGNSLVHRAFHALPLLQNSKGEYTNAVYGFVMMFQKALKELEPTHGAAAFDVSKRTFRTEIYEQYKATRKETPVELRGQFIYIKNIIEAFGFPVIEQEGFEADDIIGTLAARASEGDFNTFIVTGDRDAFQLIKPNVTVLLTRKGISEIEKVDGQALYEKYALTPKQIIDLKALMGDSSDNIPGVPGVGEKTALKLLLEYGTLDNIFEHLQEIKGKLQQRLAENKELAYISKDLATIDTNVQIDTAPEACILKKLDVQALKGYYLNLGFKTLLKDLPEDKPAQAHVEENIKLTEIEVREADALKDILNLPFNIIYIDYTPPALHALPERIYFAFNNTVYYVDYPRMTEAAREVLKCYFAGESNKIFHDLKAAFLLLQNAGFELQGSCEDLSIMAYLINPGTGKYSPQDIALDILQTAVGEEPAQAAAALAQAYPKLLKKIEEYGLLELYQTVELPLVKVLADMERTGIVLDVKELQSLDAKITEELEKLIAHIYTLAGEKFNINSPKQLGVILFEKLNLPVIKKTKTGYSTGAEVLEELAGLHEIVAKILEYRTLAKLKSTYIEGLQNALDKSTGRLHTSFNQTITATGRLSSTEPNLQNIPIRMEVGRQIRKAFKASKGYKLLAADYSQIELRILAHLSQDVNLVDAFVKGQDIHTRTAKEVFGVSDAEVTKEMRRRAKAVNFGIVYGISDFGLSRDLKIPRKEAKTYIDNYFKRYQGVKSYLEHTVEQARKDGFVTTICNRRRYLPDIYSSNRNVRSFGERTAMNTPIQGSAADIIKIAMVKIVQALREQGYKTKMLLQVHDELIFEVPADELYQVAELVKETMEDSLELRVPLIADLKFGEDWYDMITYTGGE